MSRFCTAISTYAIQHVGSSRGVRLNHSCHSTRRPPSSYSDGTFCLPDLAPSVTVNLCANHARLSPKPRRLGRGSCLGSADLPECASGGRLPAGLDGG